MGVSLGGGGRGGGGRGLEIEVVQALPVYQEDIKTQPTFYFRRSDNTYHQAFSEALAADEDASMTRNVLAQANITGTATWRGTVDNLNDVMTPVADNWAFEHRAGHNRLWWYDGTTWYGSDHPGRPSIETAFGAGYVFLRPNGTFATDAALRNAFNDRDIDYDASKQYLFLDVADDNVHRVTAFSPFIPAGTKKVFVNVGVGTFDAAAVTAIADGEIDTGVKDYAKTGGGQVPDGDIPAGVTRDVEVKAYALAGGRNIAPGDADDTFMLDAEFTAAAVQGLIGLTAQQLNDLVTGGSITGRTVTLNQADGSTITFMVPPDTNTQDGVLASGSIDDAGTELTLTLDTGADIVVDIPATLRTGGGGGVTEARVNQLIEAGTKPFARDGGPEVPENEIAAAIMRDAEFTAAAIRNLIGLTQAEQDELFVGASITNNVITFTQEDGTTVPITLPADMDTQDGVADGGSISADGMTLTITRSDGLPDLTIDIPAALRATGISEMRVNELIEAGVRSFARTTQEEHPDTDEYVRQVIFGNQRLGRHLLVAPVGVNDVVLYRSTCKFTPAYDIGQVFDSDPAQAADVREPSSGVTTDFPHLTGQADQPDDPPAYMLPTGVNVVRADIRRIRLVFTGTDVPYISMNVRFFDALDVQVRDVNFVNWEELVMYLRLRRADGVGRTFEGMFPFNADVTVGADVRGDPYSAREFHLREYLGLPTRPGSDGGGDVNADEMARYNHYARGPARTMMQAMIEWLFAEDGYHLARLYPNDDAYAGAFLTAGMPTPTQDQLDAFVVDGDVVLVNGADPRFDLLTMSALHADTRPFRTGDKNLLDDLASRVAALEMPPAEDHTRRYAISEDEVLSDAEAQGAEESTTQDVTGPAWGAGELRYRYLGVPENEDDITDVTQGGLSVFSAFESYVDNQGDFIIVDGHKWIKDTNPVDGEFNSNQTLTIVQA